MTASIVILISGRGSNMAAIIQAAAEKRILAKVAAVISNRLDAAGLQTAQAADIPIHCLDHRDFADRADFDRALTALIDPYRPDAVVMAGFMRILTPAFINHYRGRLLNIHPSLLPSFRGLHAHAQALAAGVKWHGCTVHFVTDDLDGGPIIAQGIVPVLPTDTEAALAARVLQLEHQIYPMTVNWLLQGRLAVEDGVVKLRGNDQANQFVLWMPV